MSEFQQMVVQAINRVSLQNRWHWTVIADKQKIEPDWHAKLVSWAVHYCWPALVATLDKGNAFHPGGQKKELWLDSFQEGECHENMFKARRAGLIDEIWAGFAYDHGKWNCHVWGFKEGLLCDKRGPEEYFGVKVE